MDFLTCIQPWGAVCVCACSTARGTGERVTSKPWKPLFGNSIHPSLQPLVVSGTLQLCHNHSSWKHLSLWSGAELHFYPHKCFASVLPTAIPGCHEAFGVCPFCWCLQSLVTLGTAAMSWFDPGPISCPSLPRLFTREAVKARTLLWDLAWHHQMHQRAFVLC